MLYEAAKTELTDELAGTNTPVQQTTNVIVHEPNKAELSWQLNQALLLDILIPVVAIATLVMFFRKP